MPWVLRWQDVLDILIIAFFIYRLLLLLVDTRAMQLVKGILIIALFAAATSLLDLKVISWLLGKLLSVFFIAIPVLFQPELRRLLEELGRGRLWRVKEIQEQSEHLSDELTRALLYLQVHRIGALIVLQRETGLRDVWRSAVMLKAEISQELLIAIFWPGNPLHDGAVILDRKTIIAAACYLPLTQESNLSRWFGTRHRAALGVTEISDALALVVSEERGEISLAVRGHLSRGLREDQIRRLLRHYFMASEEDKSLWSRLREELSTQWPEEDRHEDQKL